MLKIIGPCWYNKIEWNGKIIHNFGDVHDKKTKCVYTNGILFQDWLDRFIKEKKQIVDVFFELPPPIKTQTIYDLENIQESYIRDILVFFKPCVTLTLQKSVLKRQDECNYPNARFHMIDIRNRLLYKKMSIEESTNTLYQMLSTKDLMNDIKKRIKDLLKNMNDKSVVKFVDKKLKELFEVSINNPDDNFYMKQKRIALFMDLFMLIRICRNYDTGKRKDFENSPVTLAVCYAGFEHSKSISLLFEELGATVSKPVFRLNHKNKLLQCVNLESNF